jgi:hypothetical protein
LFCDAATGLRAQSSAAEIARFEWANAEASDGMKAMIRGLRPGLTDHELARLLRYNGSPTGCHWTIKTGSNRTSLASPRGEVAARGGTLSANVCYRGANCCRAGWIAEEERELPEPARGYVPEFAGPYFAAMAGWFDRLRLGTKGDDIAAWIHAALPPDRFARKLNPGHLIHLEEWLSSPIATGSQVELASGMVLQSDVSPVSAHFFTVRMEDSYALAGPALREELAAEFPALWRRVGARRQFLREELGLALPEEVLPLSNLAGVVMPYLLDPERILTLA